MNDHERTQYNKLAARVHLQHVLLTEVCRRMFTEKQRTALLADLETSAAREYPDMLTEIEQVRAEFLIETRLPIIGEDEQSG